MLLLAGCTVGPNYNRPEGKRPGCVSRRRRPIKLLPALSGIEKWWTVFQDPALQNLMRTALQQNYDVRIAATRVLQAQAQLVIARANQFPTASAGAQY